MQGVGVGKWGGNVGGILGVQPSHSATLHKQVSGQLGLQAYGAGQCFLQFETFSQVLLQDSDSEGSEQRMEAKEAESEGN